MKPVAAIAALASALSGFSAPVSADNFSAEAVAHRVNIAGRQRMLSQRMAKSSCLMVADISATSSFDQLTQTFDLFSRSDVALREGDQSMQLEKEPFPAVIKALQRIDEPWADYKLLVETAIEEIYLEDQALLALDAASLKVLKFMNMAVFRTGRAYAAHVEQVSLGQTITVDVAGRQRMLTQKAVKEACMMRYAPDPSIVATQLAETMQLFDTSLTALQDGFSDVGIQPPNSPELVRKLRDVADLWRPVKELLAIAAEGVVLTDQDLSKLASLSEPLLVTMNEAVYLYEKE